MNTLANTNSMPPLQPVQMDLGMPGCPSALELAWGAHKNSLPGVTLEQALKRPLVGRLIRAHAASIDRMNRKTRHRRVRRVQR